MNIQCVKCGTIYPLAIYIGNATSATFSDITQTCPNCGYPNKFKEGTFDIRNNEIVKTYLEEANLSRTELLLLRNLISHSISNKVTDKNVLSEEVTKINPRLGGLFNLTPLTTSDLIGFLTLLATVIFGLITLFPNEEKQNVTNITNITNNYTITPSESSFAKDFEKKQREKRLQDLRNKKNSKSGSPNKKNKP